MQITAVLGLAGFVAAAFVAASSGALFKPDDWYQSLRKPGWTPPPWVFPVVWTPLYLMIAISGWLAWQAGGLATIAFAFYAAQLVFNAAWSGLFFGMRRADLAFVDMLLMWFTIVGTIIGFAQVSETAAWLLAPYLLWVSIAGVLNLSVWRLNHDRFARV